MTARVIAVRSGTGGVRLTVYAPEGDVMAVELTPRAALLLGADLTTLAAGMELSLEPRAPVLRGEARYGQAPLGPMPRDED
jgi:hypothetical protein